MPFRADRHQDPAPNNAAGLTTTSGNTFRSTIPSHYRDVPLEPDTEGRVYDIAI
jgi:hypothetical protein